MNIKKLPQLMNEEKVRKEAAVALFNALGPKHIATAEAYEHLGMIALSSADIEQALEYYKKAETGYSSYYKDGLVVNNLSFISGYFQAAMLCDDEDTCERLLDLYFDGVTDLAMSDQDEDEDDEEEDFGFSEERFIILTTFELFLSYMIAVYSHDDLDFVFACQTYTDYIDTFDSYGILGNETCALIVQYFIQEGNLGEALGILIYLTAFSCYESKEEGIQIGKMLFSLVDFLNEAGEVEVPEYLKKLKKIGAYFNVKIVDNPNATFEDLENFFSANIGPDLVEGEE